MMLLHFEHMSAKTDLPKKASNSLHDGWASNAKWSSTSSIALMEPVVAWAQESRQVKRSVTATVIGFAAWGAGLATVFSFNVMSDFHPLPFAPLEGKTMFDLLDFTTTNLMLPVGGILIAIFAGWILSSESTREELGLPDGMMFKAWQLLLRIVAPLALAKVLWDGLGIS